MNDITTIVEKITELVKTRLNHSEKSVTMTEIERTTRELLLELGRQVVEKTTQGMAQKYPEETSECACGQKATYIRQRNAQLRTLFGKLNVKRAYYLCDGCHTGHYPLDQQLGLRPNALSAELARLVGLTGVHIPYGKGSELLEELAQISISQPCLAKTTGQIGEVVQEREEKLKQKALEPSYLAKRKRESRKPLRLYGAIDATKVQVRQAGEHLWRDLKLGAWFEAGGNPPKTPDGNWTIAAENIRYYADIAAAADFTSLVWATAVEQKADLAAELIILGDGAEWIWNIVKENFPHAIQILDWFHATEHLVDLAKVVFAQEDKQEAWLSTAKQLMWEGETEALITACQALPAVSSADEIRTTVNYFVEHKERMRYAHFRRQGYQIGSGTIESAAKQIGMMRMKVPGASWNTDMAVKVAKARAAYLSDRWRSLPLAA